MTKTLLHIDSSVLGEVSTSRKLTAAIVDALQQNHPEGLVTYRDLADAPPAHLTGRVMMAMRSGDLTGLSEEERAQVALSEELLEEFLAADTVVIGAPMYNFSLPTQLKAWVDRLSQAGRTFQYTETGPVGLAGGKRVVIASSRGGMYAGTPLEAMVDHQESYLRGVLGFWGITKVEIVRAEGTSMGPQAVEQAMVSAQEQIDRLRIQLLAA
ncbi:FMN-dependent NADH-azoreductase [Rubellimicrobium rubrum]|uniref:FMN dependent NADH:quinone oxidoreductase n=1 Tax=Rubellimicrobium rubrum TaxID=2585369 RepID=A0A5C4MS28_9RHOB|nr:FMN-dependent NADH-azoreductase [Rubellimicrobium rubrum]TNC47722.1 FMN-dependent NADH-azoreductase [Rubellimicrobium rubrum]